MTNTQKLLAISQISNQKDIRDSFKVIHFTGTHAITTDGFMLAKTPCEIQPSEGMKAKDLIAEPYQKMKPYDGVNNDGAIIQTGANKVVMGTINPQEIKDLTYPSIEHIERKQGDNTHLRIGLGLGVLEKIVKMMKKSGKDVIELEFSEESKKPIYGKLGDIDLTIMPCVLHD